MYWTVFIIIVVVFIAIAIAITVIWNSKLNNNIKKEILGCLDELGVKNNTEYVFNDEIYQKLEKELKETLLDNKASFKFKRSIKTGDQHVKVLAVVKKHYYQNEELKNQEVSESVS